MNSLNYKSSAPEPTSSCWTPLDLTYDDTNCFLFRYLAPNHPKYVQASRHSHTVLDPVNLKLIILIVASTKPNQYIGIEAKPINYAENSRRYIEPAVLHAGRQ
jgi:hypothetical protein